MASVRDFIMPDLGEGLTEGEIIEWLVAEGDSVTVDQPIAEMLTDKATVQVPTPFAGRVARLHGSPGDTVKVGAPLISIEVDGEPSASGNVLVGYGTSETGTQVPRRRRVTAIDAATATPSTSAASPLVRRRAAELGIDLAGVTGTGPGGLVTSADLERAAPAPGASEPSPPELAPGVARTRLSGVDRVSAERLGRSHREAPTATAWISADASALLRRRDQLDAANDEVRITPFALLLHLCVRALQRFPRLNAHFDTARNEIVRFDAVHLGVAVQTDRGLVVPVIRDANRLSELEIAAQLQSLAQRARAGGLDGTEMAGSTFTVSNFGAFGVDGGTAIINPPEAAILGVGRVIDRPWVVDGQLVVRKVVEVSLVFDHRVADGAVGGGFIRHLAELIENPEASHD